MNCPERQHDAPLGSRAAGENRQILIPIGIKPVGFPMQKDTIGEDDWHR